MSYDIHAYATDLEAIADGHLEFASQPTPAAMDAYVAANRSTYGCTFAGKAIEGVRELGKDAWDTAAADVAKAFAADAFGLELEGTRTCFAVVR